MEERLALWYVLGVLAVWRMTHLLHLEHGPWGVLSRARAAAERLGLGRFGAMFLLSQPVGGAAGGVVAGRPHGPDGRSRGWRSPPGPFSSRSAGSSLPGLHIRIEGARWPVAAVRRGTSRSTSRTGRRPTLFEYSGEKPMTLFGRVTGVRYLFHGPGARVSSTHATPAFEVVKGLEAVKPPATP